MEQDENYQSPDHSNAEQQEEPIDNELNE